MAQVLNKGRSSLLGLKQAINLAKVNASTLKTYETLQVTVPKPFVYHVELNRPKQRNAINIAMWLEFGKCFKDLHEDPDCRVVVLSGAGQLFCAGLDFKSAMANGEKFAEVEDSGRKGRLIYSVLRKYQESISQLELCSKPVLAAVHSGCIGAGTSLITAADMRYCTKDAWFQIKEVLLGLAADVGVIQRMQKVIGNDSLFRELCYSGRQFTAEEALSCGLVSKIFDNRESMMKGVFEIAEDISTKSPIAIQGLKESIIYSRDHSVQEGLNQIAIWNQLMLQSEDFSNATIAVATKQDNVVFAKL